MRLTLKHIVSLLLTFTLSMLQGSAQQESSDVRRGNSAYEEKHYTQAEIDYRRGLGKNRDSFSANFNLGNALYRQGKYQDAVGQFITAGKLARNEQDKSRVASSFHNIGNSMYNSGQYDKALEAYKNALKINPKDEETRYNMALTKLKLQQQNQQNQNQNQQQQQQRQDQNQNQQQNRQNQDQDQDTQQQKPSSDQMSKEQAERLLQALRQDENAVQKKVQRKQQRAGSSKTDKDW